MPEAIMECSDFSDFQEALKSMRRTDDIIINTINSAIPTDSFHPDTEGACKNLYETLEKGYTKRDNLIKNCISITASKVKQLKDESFVKTNDVDVSKALRFEQTKLRMLKVEQNVEDLIKQRTMNIFNGRCRRFYKPT